MKMFVIVELGAAVLLFVWVSFMAVGLQEGLSAPEQNISRTAESEAGRDDKSKAAGAA
jgi:hypothetical protein